MPVDHHAFWFTIRSARTAIVASLLAFATTSLAFSSTDSTTFTVGAETRSPALTNATVELWAGANAFSGSTDAQGRLNIEVTCDDEDDLVHVVVRGTGPQQGIDMARVMNACGVLETEALASGSFRAGPINPVSTAFYAITRWFERRHQEYDWPMSATELAEVRYLLGGLHVAYIAKAVDYWAAGLGNPPPGIDSSLALVLDKPALMSYVTHVEETVDLELLQSLLLRTRWDAAQFQRPSQPEHPGLILTSCPELQRRCDDLFELNSDQTGQFSSNAFSGLGNWLDLGLGDVIFADALQLTAGNLLALQFDPLPGQPLSFFEFLRLVEVPGKGFVQTPFRRETTRAYLRIIDANDLFPMVGIQTEWREFFPEYPELGVTQTRGQFSSILNGLLDWDDRPSWTGPELSQQWALPLLKLEDDETPSPFTMVRIQFTSADSAIVVDTNETVAWSFSDQVLTIDSPTLGPHRYHFLGGLPDRHQLMVVDAQPDDSTLRRTATAAAIPATLAPGWEATDVAGRYVGGFDFDNWLPTNPADPGGFFVLDLYPDGTGLSNQLEDLDAPMTTGVPLSWELDDQSGLIIKRAFTFQNQWRRWQRLNDVPGSDDIYVLETQPLLLEPDQEPPETQEQRIQFYRRLDLVPQAH